MKKSSAKSALLFDGEHVLTLQDFPDLKHDIDLSIAQESKSVALMLSETVRDSHQRVWDVLDRAGLQVDHYVYQALPSWQQVVDLYGANPVLVGQNTCESFQNSIPASRRYVGVADQMNMGTNALAKLLSNNLQIPSNQNANKGILWTVPWYKHAWISLRNRYRYRDPQEHNNVLLVVIIQDLYFWMNR
jgi:hypothetical protein